MFLGTTESLGNHPEEDRIYFFSDLSDVFLNFQYSIYFMMAIYTCIYKYIYIYMYIYTNRGNHQPTGVLNTAYLGIVADQ